MISLLPLPEISSMLQQFNFNPNKAGLFEGSFFWGESQFEHPSYFKKNLSNINITLYNC